MGFSSDFKWLKVGFEVPKARIPKVKFLVFLPLGLFGPKKCEKNFFFRNFFLDPHYDPISVKNHFKHPEKGFFRFFGAKKNFQKISKKWV